MAIALLAAGNVAVLGWITRPAIAQPPSHPKGDVDAEAKGTPPQRASAWLEAQDKSGSSVESEQAVELALAWLAEHQFPAGGWSFDHRLGPCRGRCSNPGKELAKAVNAATAMALLPFIGHGNTHRAGPYRQTVTAGLQGLVARVRGDGSLCEPDAACMYPAGTYSQALGILAFYEDLRIGKETPGQTGSADARPNGDPLPAATDEKGARPAANRARSSRNSATDLQALQQQREQQQRELLDRMVPLAASKALAFTLACQDPRHGGWRYEPFHPESDISVTGWHVMALHSASAVGMPIPPRTSAGVTAFLDSVQGNGGAVYGYQYSAVDATPARSSMGLLCRVYTGWDRPQLQRGVEILAAVGPSENDMYYNYYGTLLLHHYGGPLWDAWNRKLRDYLVRTQSHDGHETGSWSFRKCLSNSMGGRHFDTCMACLILESYYQTKPADSSPSAPKEISAGKSAD